jgi:hypothetical protein
MAEKSQTVTKGRSRRIADVDVAAFSDTQTVNSVDVRAIRWLRICVVHRHGPQSRMSQPGKRFRQVLH